jgi:hypothetical protein
VNDGSALLLPTPDLPVLAQALSYAFQGQLASWKRTIATAVRRQRTRRGKARLVSAYRGGMGRIIPARDNGQRAEHAAGLAGPAADAAPSRVP